MTIIQTAEADVAKVKTVVAADFNKIKGVLVGDLEAEAARAKNLLGMVAAGKYQSWLSVKLIVTVVGSAILIVLLRDQLASLTWALVTFWSVFLITRAWHDVYLKMCDTSTKNAVIAAVVAGKITLTDASVLDSDIASTPAAAPAATA